MTEASESTPSYFERLDAHRFKPTTHASGAWRNDEQHFSPLGGLLVHAIERARAGRPDLLISRISFDILGKIALDEFEIQVETTRPGRTIELVEATAIIAGRPVVRARAWFLAELDTGAAAGGEPDPLPAPESLASWPMNSLWPGGFIASLDTRPVGTPRPGRNTAWVSTRTDLVAGEPVSPVASYVALVDTANGIAVRQEPTKWMFPNVDLSIHLYRQPEGRWTGLDTTVVFGGRGQGLTSSVLHDTRGPIGTAQQSLTVRPLEQ
ncbi:Thioesterase-like superfamily protein [Saccharopolyspora shandongensis]|uniref:Thioesterase-like superfamily protein n=1 Tax=Saccharopolyspora shandongensis TaxID=418495 RepID=A0A1H2ZPZ0_9PSEU|nr:thioesterase family protein [Saccharopolyspora shandongensis]SDX19592.1 Thioesterase-like superfamily protein [Saccharopolyspora shandongensis]